MRSRTLTTDRLLLAMAAGGLLVFVALDLFAYHGSSLAELRRARDQIAEAAAAAEDRPVEQRLALVVSLPSVSAISTRKDARAHSLDPRTFFTDDELAAQSAERERLAKVRGSLAPPLRVRAERRGVDVLLRWDENLGNAAVRDAAASRGLAAHPDGGSEGDGADTGKSLLTAGYQVYRWREREAPTLVANAELEATSWLDRGVGPRGGTIHYSVKTVLKDRIGDVETLIESSAAEVISLELEDLFTLRIAACDASSAVLEVAVPGLDGDSDQRTHQFQVDKGAQVGSILRLESGESDFRTGLTVEAISAIETTSERQRRVPMFNADGSRAVGESGFLYRDEVRSVPIRRVTVRLVDERGEARELVRDDDMVPSAPAVPTVPPSK